ncbi:MAG: hypothetical protein EOM23_01610 [Candidatus Moranbacteria bacterium]|nr:hypothetical protein [Candidatus Moranbacteria bacterium]
MQKQRLDVNIYTHSNTWQICFHRIISMDEISDEDYLVLPDPTDYYYSGEHIYEAMVEIEQKYGDFFEINFRFESANITLEEMEENYNEYLQENEDDDRTDEKVDEKVDLLIEALLDEIMQNYDDDDDDLEDDYDDEYDDDDDEEISVYDMTEFLINYNIATEEEIELVANINGDTIETLNDILYARTGYRDYAQYRESI